MHLVLQGQSNPITTDPMFFDTEQEATEVKMATEQEIGRRLGAGPPVSPPVDFGVDAPDGDRWVVAARLCLVLGPG